MNSLRALLSGTLDYAGLFPPASLSMSGAAGNYARYAAGEHSWMLGRFVVPLKRIDELPRDAHWRLSVLGIPGDAAAEAYETTTIPSPPPVGIVYVEVPIDDTGRLEEIAHAGMRVKIRTGGVTPDAFPSTAQVAAFLVACHQAGLAFKATAGLHHALRRERPLTYEPDSAIGTMHGFLNLFLAASFVRNGLNSGDAIALLEERSPHAFRFDDAGVEWHGRRLPTSLLHDSRENFATAFGSCSFEEPVAELREMGLL